MEYSINGLKVYTRGNKENKPIIFVHGFPYDHTMWDNQVNALKDSYYCITYDIRGLGNSYIGDGQYTMEAYVWDLFSILDGLHVESPILCGLSMGGYIALRAVQKDQDRFSSLILCDTRSEADNDEGKLGRANAIDKINVEGVQNFADGFVKKCFHPKSPERISEVYKQTLQVASNQNSLGVKGALFAMLSRTDTTNYLSQIKIPTLVLVGKRDSLTTPKIMKKMAKQIRGSKFIKISKAGHMSPIENPEKVNEEISKFLNKYFSDEK